MDAKKHHSIHLFLALAIGVALTLGAALAVHKVETHLERTRVDQDFQRDAPAHLNALHNEISNDLEILVAIAALYESSERVTRDEYGLFAQTLLRTHPRVQALEWIPRVSGSTREQFEEMVAAEFPGFRITERDAAGRLVAAAPRDEYFPVYYLEPLLGNEAALGFDIGSEHARRLALEAARESHATALSRPIPLVQGGSGVLALHPVYAAPADPGPEAAGDGELTGFALGVWRVGDLIGPTAATLANSGIALRVLDTTPGEKAAPLFPSSTATEGETSAGDGGLRASQSWAIGGRLWTAAISAGPDYAPPAPGYAGLLAFCAGLALTALASWYLRSQQIYTEDLKQANLALDREVTIRRQAQSALDTTDRKLRQVLDSAADAILIANVQGEILVANKEAEKLFGYHGRELVGQRVEMLLPQGLREKHARHRRDYHARRNHRLMGGGLELIAQHRDGTRIPVEISLSAAGSAEDNFVTAIIRDITQRKAAQEELRRLNRTHAVLSRCSRSLARAHSEWELGQDFCRNLVEVGGYCCAAVRGPLGAEGQDAPSASGIECRNVSQDTACPFDPALDQEEQASREAMSTGAPVLIRQDPVAREVEEITDPVGSDPTCQLIALPLSVEEETFGCFVIHSAEQGAFHEQEISILGELAEELAQGIHNFRQMKEQEQKVRQLREEIEQGERKRVAALLHDGVGQTLQAINLGLRRLRAGLENTTEENSALLDGSIEDLRSAISELRDLSQELRPFYLERMSLVEAIRYLCNELQGRVNPRIKVKAGTGPYEVDDRIKLQCFLIVREALSNALRHAEADRIRITFERLSPHRMRVEVYDNGKGFDPDEIARTGFGLGLPMIKERAEGVSGHAEIFSTPGKGTRLHFYLPLGPADNNHSSSPDPSGSGDEAASPYPKAAKRKASAPAQSKRGEIPWPSA